MKNLETNVLTNLILLEILNSINSNFYQLWIANLSNDKQSKQNPK